MLEVVVKHSWYLVKVTETRDVQKEDQILTEEHEVHILGTQRISPFRH